MNIYENLKAQGVPLAHHASDLYAKDGPETRELIKKHGITTASLFKSNDGSGMWWDIPFQYTPFWDAIEQRSQHKETTWKP